MGALRRPLFSELRWRPWVQSAGGRAGWLVALLTRLKLLTWTTLALHVVGACGRLDRSQASCNICSIAYGLQISNVAVLISNMFGLLCQVLFLAADNYIRTINSGWLFFSVRLSTLFNTGLVLLTALAPLSMVGHSITIVTVVMYASPLSKAGEVFPHSVGCIRECVGGITIKG